MAERGGPTTQSGLDFQNTVAAFCLIEMLIEYLEGRPDIVKVRVEAPEAVDDVVLTYADGHRQFIQVKESLRSGSRPWKDLWRDLWHQFCDSEFQRDRDRLTLWVPLENQGLKDLKSAASIAQTDASDNAVEFCERLNQRQKRLVESIRAIIDDVEHRQVTLRDIYDLLGVFEVQVENSEALEQRGEVLLGQVEGNENAFDAAYRWVAEEASSRRSWGGRVVRQYLLQKELLPAPGPRDLRTWGDAAIVLIGVIGTIVGLFSDLGDGRLVLTALVFVAGASALWSYRKRALEVLGNWEWYIPRADWGWTLLIFVTLSSLIASLFIWLAPGGEENVVASTLDGEEFNIAIAQFSWGPDGRRKSVVGTEMAYHLRDELRKALVDLGYAPEQVDVEVYESVGAQGDRATKLLEDITDGLPEDAATLLVYGYVPVGREDSYVVYFLLHNPREAMELGDVLLGEVEGLNLEKGDTNALEDRTKVLVLFSTGLVKLYTGDLLGAKGRFEEGVAKAIALSLDEALDTLYFFKGRTLAALGSQEEAASAYATALSYNDQYAMAHIGLGNIYYTEFERACQAGEPVDCGGLDLALEEYHAALECEPGHYMAWAHGKAYVNIGNVHSKCGQISGDREFLEKALNDYTLALEVYERIGARAEYLALAHYTRGIAYERLELWESAAADYEWCAGNAGTRTQLAIDCSQRLEEYIRPHISSEGAP